jgi:hypothetical protein
LIPLRPQLRELRYTVKHTHIGALLLNLHTNHGVYVAELRVAGCDHNRVLSSLAPFEQNLPLEHVHQQHIRRLTDGHVRLRDYGDTFPE